MLKKHSFSRITPVDQYLILSLFNERKKVYPKGFVHEFFEEQARKHPDSIAVTFLQQSITYRELDIRANKLAHYLLKKNIKLESLVCISLNRSTDVVISMLAVLKAGAAYIPIEPTFPVELISFLISDSSPAVIITSREYAKCFEDLGKEIIFLDTDGKAINSQSTKNPCIKIKESNLAYAIYTSGSTGKRKAALIEHKGLTNQCFAWRDALQINDHDIILQTTTFSFDVFTADWVKALTSGARMVINPRNMVLTPHAKDGEFLYNLLVDNKITAVDLTPPVLRKLFQYARNSKSLDFLRLIVVGCDAWYTNEHKKLIEFTKGKTRVVDSYGMSEGTVDSTYYEGYGNSNDSSLSLIGKPYYNNEVYILDDRGYISSVGVAGELCIAGPTLARAYLNRPKLNKERFAEITFPDGTRKRIYKSGDLAKFRQDGNLEFLGRRDHQIEMGGIRVELGEIEMTIQKHPLVQECIVVSTENKDRSKELTCFLVMNPKCSITKSELKTFLANKLPDFMIPFKINILKTMPLTQMGKIDRKKLSALTIYSA